MKEDVVYWDCNPNKRYLTFRSINDAIEDYLDQLELDCVPDELVVYGWNHIELTPDMCREPLHDLLYALDEEYADPNGPRTEATPVMKLAQKMFLQIVCDEYKVWDCERTTERKIDTQAWIKEHRLDWLDRK